MDNLRLYRFILLDDEAISLYENTLQYVPPLGKIGKYKGKELGSLSFGEVHQLRRYIQNRDFVKAFKMVFGISRYRLMWTRVQEFYKALNWLREQILQLTEREKLLIPEPDPIMEQAGASRLDVFKEMNILISLSQTYNVHPNEIAKWEYSIIFTLLYHTKISNEIEKAYGEITTEKIKKK